MLSRFYEWIFFPLSHCTHKFSLFKLIFHIVSTSFKVSCCFKFHFQFFVKLQARKIVLLSHRTSKIIVKQKNNKEFVKQTTQEKISMIATVLGWNFLSAKKNSFWWKKRDQLGNSFAWGWGKLRVTIEKLLVIKKIGSRFDDVSSVFFSLLSSSLTLACKIS